MPETAVNEQCEPHLPEHEIRFYAKGRDGPPGRPLILGRAVLPRRPDFWAARQHGPATNLKMPAPAGDMYLGTLTGYPKVRVNFRSDSKAVIPRNLGVFGTVGSGKTNTSQVLIEEAAQAGFAVIVLDVEGEYVEMDKPSGEAKKKAALRRKMEDYAIEPAGLKNLKVYHCIGTEPQRPDGSEEIGIGMKIIRQIKPCADEKLAAAFLWHAKLNAILNLRMNPITQCPRFFLDTGEILAAGRRADAQHVLHHKNFRLKKLNIFQELPVKQPPIILNETLAVICAVHLAHGAESLTWWPANNYVKALCAD